MYDAKTWDKKFSERTKRIDAEPFVMMHIPKGKRLRVLDLACGDGRNALVLAEAGHDVVAVDFSKVALEKLEEAAKEMGVTVVTLEADVSVFKPETLGEFDVVIMSHFLPPIEVMKSCYQQLKTDGELIALGFNQEDRRHLGKDAFCGVDIVKELAPNRVITNVTFADGRGDFDGIVVGK